MGGSVPLAYFITFRCYGTWLHGDQRGAVDRFHNFYGTPLLPRDDDFRQQNARLLKRDPIVLSSEQRDAVEHSIRETCTVRGWLLRAVNVRTNHVHVVVSTDASHPDRALSAFKANATRQLREDGAWLYLHSPWSSGGSKRYLWTEVGMERAIGYVINGQDGSFPDLK
jgi:REP element-mobilizing transposase RayT